MWSVPDPGRQRRYCHVRERRRLTSPSPLARYRRKQEHLISVAPYVDSLTGRHGERAETDIEDGLLNGLSQGTLESYGVLQHAERHLVVVVDCNSSWRNVRSAQWARRSTRIAGYARPHRRRHGCSSWRSCHQPGWKNTSIFGANELVSLVGSALR